MPSPEHEFLIAQVDESLRNFSATSLIGVAEAERKKFDYGCILQRDMSRPLVAQVLWSHTEGIEKDLRTLLHDSEALIKLYLVRSTTSHLMRIDEVIRSYSNDSSLRSKLTGLRLIPVPDSFDADSHMQQDWMAGYVNEKLSSDLLFGILFGQLNQREFEVFVDHGGPLGLKLAVLDEIAAYGLTHMPTFKERIGYKTDGPIRETIGMLSAAGFVQRLPRTNICLPTVKGRTMLDLTRRLMFELDAGDGWAPETLRILQKLGISQLDFPIAPSLEPKANVEMLLMHWLACKQDFGRDLLADSFPTAQHFYSNFDWRAFLERIDGVPGITGNIFDEPEFLFFPGKYESNIAVK